MKKILLVLVSLVFMSCNLAYEYIDGEYENKMEGHHLYYTSDFDVLNSIDDVSNYIRSNINYVSGLGYQEPQETFKTKKGNCTSFSTAYANTLYFVTGEECSLIAVKYTRSVVNGSFDSNHCVVELPDGTQIEPQTGEIVDYAVLYRYSFDVVF